MTEQVVNYTPEMESKLVELAETGTFDWDRAEFIGQTLGKSARSVIAKAKQLGMTYVAKDRPEPKGVVRKEVFVREIEQIVGVQVPTLKNTHKNDLIRLRDALVELNGPASE